MVSSFFLFNKSLHSFQYIDLSVLGQRNQNHQTGAQLHKLLVSGTTASSNGLTTSATNTSELTRLPGGAELNILSTGTNGLYRSNNGKLSIVNGVNGGAFTFKGKSKIVCRLSSRVPEILGIVFNSWWVSFSRFARRHHGGRERFVRTTRSHGNDNING